MICNYRHLLVLVGLLGLPVFASDSQSWSFNGTDYKLKTSDSEVSVEVKRQHVLTTKQMKSLCRKGLGLELRAKYEDKLLERGFIRETLDSWPFASLTYELTNIQFSSANESQAKCSAEVNDTGYKTNLQSTALNYAIAYYSTQQYQNIKPILPLIIKESSVAMDAAGLVTLLLSQSDFNKAKNYYQQYIDVSQIYSSKIKYWLAQWQFEHGEIKEALAIVNQCSIKQCEYLAIAIEDKIFAQKAET
ncbi:hypothetical protein BZG82_15680, partial [Salinivibrio sp. PR5]|uniref:hypothetical protein n=1 Tax=Salinivibrio sp. PR5 TaxID=1909484 RepID=UPI00098A09E5